MISLTWVMEEELHAALRQTRAIQDALPNYQDIYSFHSLSLYRVKGVRYLSYVKPSRTLGPTSCNEMWFLGGEWVRGVAQRIKSLVILSVTKPLNTTFPENHPLWPTFSFPCGNIVPRPRCFPLFPWHAKQKAPISFLFQSSATNNVSGSCYCNVLKQLPGFPFYKFWGQEGRTLYSSEHLLAFQHHPIVGFGPSYQRK